MTEPFNILIVDDNQDLAVNVRDILAEGGYATALAYDGTEAIELARRTPFELVLVDYKLPDMDGLQLQQRLSEITEADYIVITGHASIESAAEAVCRDRVVGYEQKPLDMERLMAFIKQVSDRKAAERERERTAARIEAVFNAIPAHIRVLDREFNILDTNADPAILEKLGCADKSSILGRKCYETFIGRPTVCGDCLAVRSMESGRVETALGGEKEETLLGYPVKRYAAPIRDKRGSVLGAVECALDIGDLRRMEARMEANLREKEVLLREIHHRVKNNLTVILSLVELQAEQTGSEQVLSLFSDLHNRIMAMAMVHEDLYNFEDYSEIDFGDYLERLVSGIRHALGRPDVDFVVIAADIRLSVDVAIPCGLIVSELVTNAFKHAFPDPPARSAPPPAIQVEMVRQNGTLLLTVADNGVGMPDGDNRRESPGLGMELPRSLAEHQLRGRIEVDSSRGTRFTITLPVKDED